MTQSKVEFGVEQAEMLLDANWCQCQLFEPTSDLPCESGCYLIVCSQSCVVVSPSLERDPWIEVALARPLTKFAPRSQEATGKNNRKLHLPIKGADFEAVEIDINSRFFTERERLLEYKNMEVEISAKVRRDFSGWMARYYSRIAMPNQLVIRLKKKMYPALYAILDAEDGAGSKRHESLKSIYINWQPLGEIQNDVEYIVNMLFVCSNPDYIQEMDEALRDVFPQLKWSADGIAARFDVNTPTEIFLSDLDDFQRFTDWDSLTGLGEVLSLPS